MKIERISDSQVRFILTREDFSERDLSIAELTFNSQKAQQLFRDMMELASAQAGFELDHSPLMIEAVPLSDSIMIIVSKVGDRREADLNSPLAGLFNRLSRQEGLYSETEPSAGSVRKTAAPESRRIRIPRNIAIYSFDTLDDVSFASVRLSAFFKGASSLYKYDGKYYICIQLPFKTAVLKMGELENVLCEYGEKHVSNTVSRGFLLEHGETLISSDAVNKLASI